MTRWGLGRLAGPNPDDFGAFYLAHYPAILRYFAWRTRDPQLSAELTAETFARAFEARHRFRGRSRKEAIGWLWAIATNELRGHHRGRAAESSALQRLAIATPLVTHDEAQRVMDLATLDATRGEINDAFEELSEKQKQAIRMHVIEELPYEQIARTLDVSVDTVRKRLSAGLRRLAANSKLKTVTEASS